MQGRRIYKDDHGAFYADRELKERIGYISAVSDGDYWQWAGGWAARCPGGLIANLAGHSVVEHEDGTITVSPSILVRYDGKGGRKEYHGFLERGVWREC